MTYRTLSGEEVSQDDPKFIMTFPAMPVGTLFGNNLCFTKVSPTEYASDVDSRPCHYPTYMNLSTWPVWP